MAKDAIFKSSTQKPFERIIWLAYKDKDKDKGGPGCHSQIASTKTFWKIDVPMKLKVAEDPILIDVNSHMINEMNGQKGIDFEREKSDLMQTVVWGIMYLGR